MSFWSWKCSQALLFKQLNHVRLCDPMNCSLPGFPILHHLPEFAQTHVCPVSDAIQSSPPLSPSSSCPQSFPASGSFPVSWLLTFRCPKYWSFSFSISPANEYSGLISFETDWFDLLAVQGTLKSLLQYHTLKVSVRWHSVFFMVWKNHSFDYMDLCYQSDVSAF